MKKLCFWVANWVGVQHPDRVHQVGKLFGHSSHSPGLAQPVSLPPVQQDRTGHLQDTTTGTSPCPEDNILSESSIVQLCAILLLATKILSWSAAVTKFGTNSGKSVGVALGYYRESSDFPEGAAPRESLMTWGNSQWASFSDNPWGLSTVFETFGLKQWRIWGPDLP